jgi:DNA polymerase delta subunit 3
MLDAPVEAESQPEATPVDTPEVFEAPEPEGDATVTVENGRRRGRRRVMQKKKVKDEDGYLGKQKPHALFSVS